MNIPNTLSLVRIFLVPVLVVFLIVVPRPYNLTAAAVFLAAVLTDWLDGRIARSRRQVTTLGKLLDPVADKLLISASLISLVQVGRVPAWMVVLIVGRDLAITGLRGIAASQSVIIQANEFGKATMAAEVLAVALLILNWPAVAAPLGKAALGVAILLSLVSGVAYFHTFWRRINLAK
ncbi:MAG: CDP-diacylglycerol--glycerol-3-phosphate 3-phosphatidyltransferase [candidate division NC10 bacterium]|nr:CDP-diacylglycerol--glycerol-3-phosphate 3-phosphatidyltransferase [candidate division NC10 bacterium]MBI2455188.1 CDP-diacylglycerol--glycerol-3-phosphate 3-phosphatidyltransferase [candidate division NC10 bacterium]MBI3086331.1 CDP-diacylglycerol--glycerol-3-phosphate 3-phosphatidyltransferase [candidate division NC10 bacterium]